MPTWPAGPGHPRDTAAFVAVAGLSDGERALPGTHHSGGNGIVVSETYALNRIEGNTVTGNAQTNEGASDLFDENGTCAFNTWTSNTHATANPECLQ